MSSLVASQKTACSWLTRNAINNYLSCRIQILANLILLTSAAPETTAVMDITVSNTEVIDRIKGMRPDGSVDKKKHHFQLAALASKKITYLSDREEEYG